jgi:hypothetical protein
MPRQKTGGRKKGTPNKATAAMAAAVAATGKAPLEVMIENMRHFYAAATSTSEIRAAHAGSGMRQGRGPLHSSKASGH